MNSKKEEEEAKKKKRKGAEKTEKGSLHGNGTQEAEDKSEEALHQSTLLVCPLTFPFPFVETQT